MNQTFYLQIVQQFVTKQIVVFKIIMLRPIQKKRNEIPGELDVPQSSLRTIEFDPSLSLEMRKLNIDHMKVL